MKEGGLSAPTRHPLNWEQDAFSDPKQLDQEMRRVFDVCHGCRRCFNLCDSFPRLFDLIDESPTFELDGVESPAFKSVVEACTLCDMCFMTKCPYVPPHPFNIDFPHLMLRHRTLENQKSQPRWIERQLTRVDRNGRVAQLIAPFINWATARKNRPLRWLMEHVTGIDRRVELPQFSKNSLKRKTSSQFLPLNTKAPGYGRKVVLYATCFGNYNQPNLGLLSRSILAHNGIETEVVYMECCGMPAYEQGDIKQVENAAKKTAKALESWVNQGYTVIPLVPSCALMMKMEWPLIVPNNDLIQKLSESVQDIAEYLVSLHKDVGLADGLNALDKRVTVHLACHSRAQNIGPKSVELLKLIPELSVDVIERCSGHGGIRGFMKGNFETALKVGKPVSEQVKKLKNSWVISECPLALKHILQGTEIPDHDTLEPCDTSEFQSAHPIEILARAYGIQSEEGQKQPKKFKFRV